MKKILTIVVVMVFLSGCTDKNTANKTLESAGFTDVKITGWNPLACGEDDTYATGFIAINPQGKVVEGTVCSGVLKALRLDFKKENNGRGNRKLPSHR